MISISNDEEPTTCQHGVSCLAEILTSCSEGFAFAPSRVKKMRARRELSTQIGPNQCTTLCRKTSHIMEILWGTSGKQRT